MTLAGYFLHMLLAELLFVCLPFLPFVCVCVHVGREGRWIKTKAKRGGVKKGNGQKGVGTKNEKKEVANGNKAKGGGAKSETMG